MDIQKTRSQSQRGMTAIEYGLMSVVIACLVVAGVTMFHMCFKITPTTTDHPAQTADAGLSQATTDQTAPTTYGGMEGQNWNVASDDRFVPVESQLLEKAAAVEQAGKGNRQIPKDAGVHNSP